MEAIALIFTKFSEELIAAQLALLSFASSAALYLFVVRKKKKESAEWVPAAIVRAYLDKVKADEQEVRFKLFGEAPVASATHAPLATALSTVTTVTDPALIKEVEALRAQLQSSDQRTMEFDKMLNGLKAEKAALEEKLKAAAAGAPVAAGPSPETLKELEEMKARLQEYEVIEDDLANLKKFQKENEQLRQKVETYEKGGAATVAAAPAPAPAATVVSGGGEKPTMTLVSSTPAPAPEPAPAAPVAAAPAPAPEAAPAAPVAAAEAAPAPESNTNVLQAANPAEAAPEKSAKQKEEELLSEFEKMLAS